MGGKRTVYYCDVDGCKSKLFTGYKDLKVGSV